MKEFKKIDVPFATDIIAQKFDNILELIHPNAFVYGGALRDIIAGVPLEGDLDIIASGTDYDYCISKISKSSKWRYSSRLNRLIPKTRKHSYKSNKAITNISMFETFGNKKVELIKAKRNITGKYIDSCVEIVRTVDIRCCGVIMDVYGNVFEIVKSARQDCLDRILRLNILNSNSNLENLKNRIAKLEKRGWTSKINLNKVEKTFKKLEKAAREEYLNKIKNRKVISPTVNPTVKAKNIIANKDGSTTIEFVGVDINVISRVKIKDLIRQLSPPDNHGQKKLSIKFLMNSKMRIVLFNVNNVKTKDLRSFIKEVIYEIRQLYKKVSTASIKSRKLPPIDLNIGTPKTAYETAYKDTVRTHEDMQLNENTIQETPPSYVETLQEVDSEEIELVEVKDAQKEYGYNWPLAQEKVRLAEAGRINTTRSRINTTRSEESVPEDPLLPEDVPEGEPIREAKNQKTSISTNYAAEYNIDKWKEVKLKAEFNPVKWAHIKPAKH